MGVESISSSANSASSSAASAQAQQNQMDYDAFLQLMIAQMQAQDPTDPMDSSEYLSQLAEFSTVSGLTQLQDTVATLSESLRSSQVLDGTNLVDRDVLIDSSQISLPSEGSVYGTVEVPEGTRSVSMAIKDSSGQTVRTVALSSTEGEVVFEWDGNDTQGTRANAGLYTIEVVADVAGTNEQLATQVLAHVGSVSIDPSTYSLTLNTDLGTMSLADVRRVL